MSPRLKDSHKIWKLAKDLGLRHNSDPIPAIIHYCEKKVRQFLKEYPECTTLTDLLDWVAAKAKTSFEVIFTDQDLEDIRKKYLTKGEIMFVRLAEELSENVYGITFRLTQSEPWENEFVSIIDCRGEKSFRSYYTKWHEIAHLLVLTDQLRLCFTRTLHLPDTDPEELLIDIIAGHFGFFGPLINNHIKTTISFEEIERLRLHLCPEASIQSSIINVVKAWPEPCLLLSCSPALKKCDARLQSQPCFDFRKKPLPTLRATRVTANEAALRVGMRIFENMRVPTCSIIYMVFNGEIDQGDKIENLSWWEASDGTRLSHMPVRVMAKSARDSVYTLIIPEI